MDIVLRVLAIYLILVVLFRTMGKRTMAQVTTVDLVLLLVISEATQQAMLGDDYSITTSALAIITLMFVDWMADLLKFKSTKFSRLIEGAPIVLVEHGKPLETRMRKEHININDVLLAARKQQGLLHLTQIEYAILESSGDISIIPASDAAKQEHVDRTTSAPDG